VGDVRFTDRTGHWGAAPTGHRQRHPRTQRKRAQHLLVQLFLGVGPPDADAAQLAFRPPQPEKVPGRGELLCSDRLGGTTPVDLRGICARRNSRGDFDQEVFHGSAISTVRHRPGALGLTLRRRDSRLLGPISSYAVGPGSHRRSGRCPGRDVARRSVEGCRPVDYFGCCAADRWLPRPTFSGVRS